MIINAYFRKTHQTTLNGMESTTQQSLTSPRPIQTQKLLFGADENVSLEKASITTRKSCVR